MGQMMLWLFLIPVVIYFILLVYISRGFLIKQHYEAESNSGIYVSVVVACKNEEKNIASLLSDLTSQNYPGDKYDIIVVDDNSVDRTHAIASSFCEFGRVRVLKNKGSGKKSGLMTGMDESKAELILTTDADCRIKPGWIAAMASFFSRHNPDLIIGPVQIEGGEGFFQSFQKLEFLSLQGITAATARLERPVLCNGANLGFTKDIYSKYAGNLHNELASGDDIFLLQNIRFGKGKILWIGQKNAEIVTQPSGSISAFLRQRARWISKSGSYTDRFTQSVAVITLLANIAMALMTVGILFVPGIIVFSLSGLIIKSVPDLLILTVMASHYKKTNLLWWFLPSQVIYPFYVIAVSVYSLSRKNKW